MERMLEGMVIFVAKIHNYILSLNDAYEKNLTWQAAPLSRNRNFGNAYFDGDLSIV